MKVLSKQTADREGGRLQTSPSMISLPQASSVRVGSFLMLAVVGLACGLCVAQAPRSTSTVVPSDAAVTKQMHEAVAFAQRGDGQHALAVIGDVFKTRVYDLCRAVNRAREVIPAAILEKPPSAALRPGQKDTDSLPPYEVLDPILEAYVEHYEAPEKIAAARGLDLETVRAVVKMVERSEYKRQQAALVLKVTPKAFGMGRRFPIAAKA